MYNTLKCVETLGNVPSLIFKTLGQLGNVAEPFHCSVHRAFTISIAFHSASLEILSPSLHFKQPHVLPAYFKSKKIKANHQHERSSMETKGTVSQLTLILVSSNLVCVLVSRSYLAPQESGKMVTAMKKKKEG